MPQELAESRSQRGRLFALSGIPGRLFKKSWRESMNKKEFLNAKENVNGQ
jgi:hypothetical protein